MSGEDFVDDSNDGDHLFEENDDSDSDSSGDNELSDYYETSQEKLERLKSMREKIELRPVRPDVTEKYQRPLVASRATPIAR
uniref:Uncharacterized protein n=1 Tax=Trichogramma kaykai TaxID=54128 RepID=A0ABD2X7W9_9HYME